MNLIVHRAAEEESLEAAKWFEDRQEGLGVDFLRTAREVVSQIPTDPEKHPRYEGIRTKADIRRAKLGRFSYLAIYQIWNGDIYVLSICHSSRRPGYWRKRMMP